MSDNSNRWTEAEDARLVALARQGKSSFAIARAMGRVRNSVVGRANRLKIRFTSQEQRPAVRNAKLPKPFQPPKVKAVHHHPGNIANKRESRANDPEFKHVTPAVSVQPLMVSLMDLRPNQCKFPVGDPRLPGFGFCGHPQADGVYCRPHAKLCYTAPEARRRAA